MPQLEMIGVKKRFGDLEVIHGIDLAIEEGEFVVFVGPSGCGKSTALRVICGLESMSEGDIRIGGVSVRNVPASRRGVAMVFQSYALYPHMTVAENMGFSLRMEGVPKRLRDEKVLAAASILKLDALLDRKPKQLSGGQRQRVAIGRAIVRQPKVFLFDEPLSNLDAELRVQMRFELSRLHRELGTTVVYVTHDQVEAMTLADRIVVLRDGRVEQIGTPMDLYLAPDNTFVAGFIGSPRMNLLDAAVTRVSGSEVQLALGGAAATAVTVTLPGTSLAAGDRVTLGIRPEALRIDGAGLVDLTARIDFVEQLGGACYAYAPDHAAGALAAVPAVGAAPVVAGTTRRMAFEPGDCLVFDATGRRLPGVPPGID